MKQFGNLLQTNMWRAVYSGSFLMTVFLLLLVEMLSVIQMLMMGVAFSTVEIVDNVFAGTGSATVILMLFPLLPFALSYAKEEEERAVTFWVIRAKAEKYMAAKYLVACMAAFLSVIVSFALFVCALSIKGYPLCNELIQYGTSGYGQFLSIGKPIVYLVAYSMDRGLSAAMMAGCAVWISTIYPSRYLAFVGPVCFYFLMLRLSVRLPLQVVAWVEGTYDSPAGGVPSFLCKLGVALLVCLIFGCLSVIHVKRRWNYA